jgi:hypothetical protein
MVVVPATVLPCPPVSGTAPSPPTQIAIGCPAVPTAGTDRVAEVGVGAGAAAAAVGQSWPTMAAARAWRGV